MGSSSSRQACSRLNCTHGEPQEVCAYDAPCDWELTMPCPSRLDGCRCPTPYSGIASSVLPPYLESAPDAAMSLAAFGMLWGLPLLIVAYRTFRSQQYLDLWVESPFPSFIVLPRRTMRLWLAASAGVTIALVVLSLTLPADVWGACAAEGVCVYHMMFCEATRHSSSVRHPANTWSNMPYIWFSLYLYFLVAIERPRPFKLLDVMFASILLAMSIASFIWHASNCTDVHWIDIGLVCIAPPSTPHRCEPRCNPPTPPIARRARSRTSSAPLQICR